MEPLIYYPTFEPPSEIWLKFALLYFENFKPIVPYERQHLLSHNFRQIVTETDLINLRAPNYDEGYRASLNAIDEVEKILTNTYQRSYLFGHVNIVRNWKDQNHWNSLVYQEKFSIDWSKYCCQKGLGRVTDEGLLLSESLSYLFMTYLAKEIAFSDSAAIITDDIIFDNFSNYARVFSPLLNQRIKFVKEIIDTEVPINLANIPFNRLIDFRNQNRNLITSFNSEIDNVQEKISNGYTSRDFIDEFNRVNSQFTSELLSFGLRLVTIPLGFYILINNPNVLTAEYVKEILNSIGTVVDFCNVNSRFRENNSRRYCKKYFTNLRKLSF